MKSATTLSLLALAAAPISAWPWRRPSYVPVPVGPFPYHHPKHHHTGDSTGFSTVTIPPYPYSGPSGGFFPTGTGTGYFPTGTGTGYFPTGTIGTGVPSGYLPVLPLPHCEGHICPLGPGPRIERRAHDIEKYRYRGPHGGPHTASSRSYTGPQSPYYPTTTYGGPTGGPTGGSGTGFNPFPTGTGFNPFPTGTGTGPSIITSSPSLSLIIDSSPLKNPTATPTNTAPSSTNTKTPTLPKNCLQKNGIAVGWLPEAVTDFSSISSNLGHPGCYFGQYSQITSSTYDDSQLTQVSPSDLQGAIFIASVQPWIPFTQVDDSVARQVAATMKKFTDQGVQVYLRFGHEMNWYATPAGKDYKGTAPEFVAAWKRVADAVKDNDLVSMYWSPNNAGGDSAALDAWWPGPETVDVVGIDVYPKSEVSFEDAYKGFHDRFSKPYGIPFVIGETGAGSEEAKRQWLEQLSGAQAKSSCENYKGFSWFEYNKEAYFYVASHGVDIAKEVLG